MKLSLNEMVTGVVMGSILLIVVMSFISRMLHQRAEKRIAKVRCVCRLCGNVFPERNAAELSHCPACNALNLIKGNGKLG